MKYLLVILLFAACNEKKSAPPDLRNVGRGPVLYMSDTGTTGMGMFGFGEKHFPPKDSVEYIIYRDKLFISIDRAKRLLTP